MSNINISGIGAGAPASGVGKVEDEAKTKKAEKNDDAKKNVKQATDENEQVELQCADGKDDGEISLGEKIKALGKGFFNGIKYAWNNAFGKKETKEMTWKDFVEKKQELQKQMNEQMQPLIGDLKERELEIQKTVIEEQIKQMEEISNMPLEPSPTILPPDNTIDSTPTILPSDD